MLKEFSLEGKTALVTGSGKGIGEAVAFALSEAGADIIATARTVEQIEQTANEVRRLGRRSVAIPCDVTKADQVEKMVEKAVVEMGKIDILVNNVGGGGVKPVVPLEYKNVYSEMSPDFDTGMTEEEWRYYIDINLTQAFLVTKAVGVHMIKRRKGKIINMTSAQASRVIPYFSAYASAKAGLNMFTRSLAWEWAKYNINVNAIGPGWVKTDLSEVLIGDVRVKEATLRMMPLRRLAEPRDIGLLAVYLASEASDNVTGQVIYCDGGLTAM